MIVVYSKPACVQCDSTKRWLSKNGLPFEERQLADHPDILEEAKAEGIMSAPICVTDQGEVWGGFSLDRLRAYKLVEEYKVSTRGGLDTPVSVS